jgi:hypothetical protein
VYNNTLEAHRVHLVVVLGVNSLFSKENKCEFDMKIIEYLGHIISAQGVSTEPQKNKNHDELTKPKK